MNRDPYDQYPYSRHLNPIPGDFNPRDHGNPVTFHLIKWAKALSTGDQGEVVKSGNEVLKAAQQTGASEGTLKELLDSMQSAVHTVQPSVMSGGMPRVPGMPGGKDAGSADGIDWYEPEERFYVLDRRSGAELSAVLSDLQFADRYIRRGARAPNRLLFVGAPGNGKTTGALWLGSQLNKPVALVRIDGVVSGLAGATAKNLRACFEAARAREAILVIDEFEAVAVSRNDTGPNVPQWTKEVTSALLQLLDSLPPEQVVIGATNIPESVDKAVLRRLRKHVFFWPPDRDARAAMLDAWWHPKKVPVNGNARKKILDVSEGQSGDFLERVAEEANRAAARRNEKAPITVPDVEFAVASALAVSHAVAPPEPTAFVVDDVVPIAESAEAEIVGVVAPVARSSDRA